MVIARIKKGKENKILNGYPWVYDDEILSTENVTKNIDTLNLFSSEYKFIGTGFFNKLSNRKILILSNKEVKINNDFISFKIKKALKWRSYFFKKPYYRLFYGESDGLAGLIIDRFKDILVVQFRNGIIYNIREIIIDSLVELIKPKAIFLRNDFETNYSEDIVREKGLLFGKLDKNEIKIEENEIYYFIDIVNSQKTGFFFDQRDSRLYSRKVIREFSFKRALDLFSFTGGFGLSMAKEGCEVVLVDKSESDLNLAERNSVINGVSDKMKFINGDAFDFLNTANDNAFEISIIDPPSLIKRRSELRKGIKFFTELSKGGSRITKNNGVLTICSCAYNFNENHIIEAMRKASLNENISYFHLNTTYQSKDHPWNIQIPETLYLKCLWSFVNKEDK